MNVLFGKKVTSVPGTNMIDCAKMIGMTPAALTRSVGQINRFFLGIGLMVAGATMTGSGIGTVFGLVDNDLRAITVGADVTPREGVVFGAAYAFVAMSALSAPERSGDTR